MFRYSEKHRVGGCCHLPHETPPHRPFACSRRCAFRSADVRGHCRRIEFRCAGPFFGPSMLRSARTAVRSSNGSEIRPTGTRPMSGFIGTTAVQGGRRMQRRRTVVIIFTGDIVSRIRFTDTEATRASLAKFRRDQAVALQLPTNVNPLMAGTKSRREKAKTRRCWRQFKRAELHQDVHRRVYCADGETKRISQWSYYFSPELLPDDAAVATGRNRRPERAP